MSAESVLAYEHLSFHQTYSTRIFTFCFFSSYAEYVIFRIPHPKPVLTPSTDEALVFFSINTEWYLF